jgi:hypothetical protein
VVLKAGCWAKFPRIKLSKGFPGSSQNTEGTDFSKENRSGPAHTLPGMHMRRAKPVHRENRERAGGIEAIPVPGPARTDAANQPLGLAFSPSSTRRRIDPARLILGGLTSRTGMSSAVISEISATAWVV